jgi:hypothetical protein
VIDAELDRSTQYDPGPGSVARRPEGTGTSELLAAVKGQARPGEMPSPDLAITGIKR